MDRDPLAGVLLDPDLAALARRAAENAARKGWADPDDLRSAALVAAWRAAGRHRNPNVPLPAFVAVCVRNALESVRAGRVRDRERRADADLSEAAGFARPGRDPAKVVAFRLDYAAWLETLPAVERRAVGLLAGGTPPAEVADDLGLSADALARIRRRAGASYGRFHRDARRPA